MGFVKRITFFKRKSVQKVYSQDYLMQKSLLRQEYESFGNIKTMEHDFYDILQIMIFHRIAKVYQSLLQKD